MFVNFGRAVTVGKDIKKVVDRDEIESRECLSLRIQEFIQGFFTDFEFSLNFVESLVHAVNGTEFKNVLHISSFCHDFSHVLVDSDELF